jgi:hypothetical protein
VENIEVPRAFLSMLLFFITCNVAYAQGEINIHDTKADWIDIITPTESAEIISKKPEIHAEFLITIIPGSLIVILDNTDITQVLTMTAEGFTYKPYLDVPAGQHVLSITASDSEGTLLQKEITFRNQHGDTLDEGYSQNELSGIYETVLEKPDSVEYIPHSKFEGNLMSDSKIKKNSWEFTFNTNVRFFDQSIPANNPLKKGFDIANWLFSGYYAKDLLSFGASIGDVLINETPYTVSSLARKGGLFNLQYETYQLNLFSVMSEQVYGQKGGLGIEGTTDDHILGISGGFTLHDNKIAFKTIYVNGGEQGSSFGVWTDSGAQKGEVVGFLLTTDLLDGKMMTELETDFSKFDPDTSDEFENKSDKALRAKVGGDLRYYSYEAMYEYIGRDYSVIGNQCLQKDKQGVSLTNRLSYGVHGIYLYLSRYNDNVRGDDLFSRILQYQGILDYSFNGIPHLPVGINYQKSVQDSSREPSGVNPINLHTDTVTGRVNFTKDRINLGAQASYSLMNDRTETNYDTTVTTFMFTSSYFTQTNSITPAFSFNRSKTHITDIITDTYTITLDIRTLFLRERASFDIGGTYNIIKANDNSVDSHTLDAHFRLAYSMKDFFKGYLNPIIAIRSTYLKITDEIYPSSNRDEFVLFLVLETTIPFAF